MPVLETAARLSKTLNRWPIQFALQAMLLSALHLGNTYELQITDYLPFNTGTHYPLQAILRYIVVTVYTAVFALS